MEFLIRLLPHIIPGLIYGIGSLGLALTFRYLKFPDFTVLGSIILGGIVSIYVTNISNPIFGLLSGTLTGSFLGLISGLLAVKLKIQKVLAGIITYTATFSFGYWLAPTGTIALKQNSMVLLNSTFDTLDVIKVSLFAIVFCFLIGVLIKTKFGSLLLAMTSESQFLKLRHRDKGKIVIITLIFGNGIVGFAGALYALKDFSAQVQSHMDFLPYSLGAIFGGNAVAMWITRKLNKGNSDNSDIEPSRKFHKNVIYRLLGLFTSEKDDSSKIGFIFFMYVVGSVFLKEISGLVNANAFTSISPYLTIPSNLQWLLIAILIAFFVYWADWDEEE